MSGMDEGKPTFLQLRLCKLQGKKVKILQNSDSSLDEVNSSGGSNKGDGSQFLDDTTFQQRLKKKRKAPMKLSQARLQKQSQLDHATAAPIAKLDKLEKDQENRASDKKATFSMHLLAKFREIGNVI